MRTRGLWAALVWLLAGGADCAAGQAVTVFAAASLGTVLEELATRGKAEGLTVRLSLAASSTLAKQVENGAPADVLISASADWMDYLDERGLIEPGTRRDLLGNTLVIVAPRGETFDARVEGGFDFPGAFEGRLALADPSHVPAGIYAKQALVHLAWWDALERRLAPASDVRAALLFVARGECAAGIVYATDAAAEPGVAVVAAFPPGLHDPIVYPMCVVKGRHAEAARRAIALLTSDEARGLFEKHGFRVLGKEKGDRGGERGAGGEDGR